MSELPKSPPARPSWKQLSLRARLLVVATKVAIVLLCLEGVSRVYWQVVHQLPAFQTGGMWAKNFPQIGAVAIPAEDDAFEVIILGPSVLNSTFGDIASRIEKGLTDATSKPVRVTNLSFPGHTSRDALLQYRRLAKRRFDLVLFYHGINDHHLNNIPDERYRADYTHASRYRHIELIDEHPEHPYFVLPYTTRYLLGRWQEQLRLRPQPGRRFLAEGEILKTPPAFRANVEEILALARVRKTQLALVTFASYLPNDYTEEAFAARTLDYDKHSSPLSLWGTTTSVPRCLEAHNAVLYDIARCNDDVVLIDVARSMPAGKRYFDDVCHLTASGCGVFADHVIAALTSGDTKVFRAVNRER
jgi:hypothetical protein